MNIVLKAIFIIGFSLLPMQLHAAANTYYVTQNGNGARTGESLGNAWAVSDFNSSANWSATDDSDKIDPGDTVNFSGSITTGLIPQGSGTSGNYITLDGYESDDSTYDLSEASGRAKIDLDSQKSDYGIYLNGKDYFIIQDFEITECQIGIYIWQGADYVKVYRNYIHYCERNGIYIGGEPTRSTNVTVGGGTGYSNVLKNIGTNTSCADIVLYKANDVIVSYNHLYANDRNYGTDGVTLTTTVYNILIEYNSIHDHLDAVGQLGEDGVDIKFNSYNIIVRYNHIYGNRVDNININGASHLYIYGNYLDGGIASIYQDNNQVYTGIYIFSNILVGGSARGYTSIAPYGSTAWFFNNTLAENAPGYTSNSSWTNMYVAGCEITIKNNIFYKGRPDEDDYLQIYVASNTDDKATFDYNRYYWPGEISKMYINGVSANAASGFERIETNGSEGDPGLTDINNHDYTVAPGAAVIGAGFDMGNGAIANVTIQGVEYPVYWDVALGPGTDWSGTIPIIEVLRRDIVGWDIGAYGYLGVYVKPEPPFPGPTNFRITTALTVPMDR